jgi:hypothetical protein
MAAPSYVYTIARVAEILGEDEDLLADLAMELDPGHGRLWVYGSENQDTMAVTEEGVENLRQLLADQKR